MTQAAQQCREYLVVKYPGARISRRACRNTSSGAISQHSAYKAGDFDSNALDIMGVVGGSWDTNVALIQKVVDDLTPNLHEWSIRKIIWQAPNHYGHAHIDFYPMIAIHKWCATRNVTPPWRYSDGHTERHRDPEPENGPYNGEDNMPIWQWHKLIDSLFEGRPDEFQGDPRWFKNRSDNPDYAGIAEQPDHVDWDNFWRAFVRVIS